MNRSTWSSFNQEVLSLWLGGQFLSAALYLTVTICGGLAAGLLGTAIAVVPSAG